VQTLPEAGNARGGLFLENCIATIKIRKDLSATQRFETICHEMLHLELSLRGYPMLEVNLVNDKNACDLTAHLESLLQHILIMPVEQTEFGYDPYVVELGVAQSVHDSIVQTPYFGSLENPDWQFLYSGFGVAYARIFVLAQSSPIIPALTNFFNKPEMSLSLQIGSSIRELAITQNLNRPKSYISTVQDILNSHIRGNEINGIKRVKLGTPCWS
jgi:hypothetical protein